MDFIASFLQGSFYQFGVIIWNSMLAMIGVVSTTTPMSFSNTAWTYVATELYPLTFSLGTMLLNIFFFVGFFRQASNLKQNFTLEVFVECCIQVVFGNALMVSGLTMMQLLFRIAAAFSGDLLFSQTITLVQEDLDVASSIFHLFFGVLFFCLCLICSLIVFFTVYGRYLQLYLLVATSPLALATLPGGPGVSQTAFAWIRTFLGKVFEIVLIVLALAIGIRMCGAISFADMELPGSIGDGIVQALQNLATMVLLTASVKGADRFLSRAFAL